MEVSCQLKAPAALPRWRTTRTSDNRIGSWGWAPGLFGCGPQACSGGHEVEINLLSLLRIEPWFFSLRTRVLVTIWKYLKTIKFTDRTRDQLLSHDANSFPERWLNTQNYTLQMLCHFEMRLLSVLMKVKKKYILLNY